MYIYMYIYILYIYIYMHSIFIANVSSIIRVCPKIGIPWDTHKTAVFHAK